jgi:predicted negative regulator of RcsB-dependent stress response
MSDARHDHGQPDAVEELEQARAFLRTHGVKTGLAVLVVLVAAGAWHGVRTWRQGREAAAQLLLSSANRLEDLEEVTGRYGSTEAAPLALLRVAKVYFDSMSYDQAQARYQEFIDRYDEHPLLPAAEMGRAHCLEARGDSHGALEAFEAFLRERDGSYLAPQAAMGRARCLEQLGRWDEARVAYEDVAAGEAEGVAARAREALETMDRRRQAIASGEAAAGTSDRGLPLMLEPLPAVAP